MCRQKWHIFPIKRNVFRLEIFSFRNKNIVCGKNALELGNICLICSNQAQKKFGTASNSHKLLVGFCKFDVRLYSLHQKSYDIYLVSSCYFAFRTLFLEKHDNQGHTWVSIRQSTTELAFLTHWPTLALTSKFYWHLQYYKICSVEWEKTLSQNYWRAIIFTDWLKIT